MNKEICKNMGFLKCITSTEYKIVYLCLRQNFLSPLLKEMYGETRESWGHRSFSPRGSDYSN